MVNSEYSSCSLNKFCECEDSYACRSPKVSRNVKHTGLSPRRRRWTACFPPRRLGAGVLNNLVTFVLSVWPRPHWSLPQTLTVNLSICRLRLYGKCHVYFYKVFLCSPVLSVIVHVGLSYLLPGNFSPNCAVLKDA